MTVIWGGSATHLLDHTHAYYAAKILEFIMETERKPVKSNINIVHAVVLKENIEIYGNQDLLTSITKVFI